MPSFGVVLPLMICIGTLFDPLGIAGALVYPLQALRLASRQNVAKLPSWTHAFFMLVAQFAKFEGTLILCWRRLCGKAIELIEYKHASELNTNAESDVP